MHPISATMRSGWLFFRGAIQARLLTTLSSAPWRTTQELSTMTSASAAFSTGSIPICSNAVPSRSESAVFIWQPMVQR